MAHGNHSAPAAPRLGAIGTAAAYLAATLAFAYAAVSLYWTLGGSLLLSTVGGSIEDIARRGGAPAVVLGLTTTVLKIAGGVLALSLVSPWGRVIPAGRLLSCAGLVSVALTLYGGILVLAGSLALAGTVRPAGAVDRTALRWHVAVWDMWFLIWGVLLMVATVAYWRVACRRRGRIGGEAAKRQ